MREKVQLRLACPGCGMSLYGSTEEQARHECEDEHGRIIARLERIETKVDLLIKHRKKSK